MKKQNLNKELNNNWNELILAEFSLNEKNYKKEFDIDLFNQIMIEMNHQFNVSRIDRKIVGDNIGNILYFYNVIPNTKHRNDLSARQYETAKQILLQYFMHLGDENLKSNDFEIVIYEDGFEHIGCVYRYDRQSFNEICELLK